MCTFYFLGTHYGIESLPDQSLVGEDKVLIMSYLGIVLNFNTSSPIKKVPEEKYLKLF